MKVRYIFATLVLAAFFVNCKSADLLTIHYTDQNNNHYTINSRRLKFDPVSEKESSSGTYSGGAPAEISLKKTDFRQISELAEKIMIASEGKNNRREMLTSVLTISGKDKTTSAILKKSEDRSKLETLLQKLRQ
ncbi:MAG: hypothetical protein KJO39_06575 [Bacteroidia bacterium]|nr:hypothetical protein [Bacteroidia bacterium]NNF31100.1 hypothetical protein [Flavobacteriaceae bacterium]NNJ81037.1 hypothetical protein [Flavobacteriaceae bacterium]NNK55562.1 hypothetical protein [Flavobacteriaceae bacterium]NNM08852.1 hypothetical protein [Flavobacteriaceae bacterium]